MLRFYNKKFILQNLNFKTTHLSNKKNFNFKFNFKNNYEEAQPKTRVSHHKRDPKALDELLNVLNQHEKQLDSSKTKLANKFNNQAKMSRLSTAAKYKSSMSIKENEVTHDSLKDLSKRLYSFDDLKVLDEVVVAAPIKENSAQIEEAHADSSIQIENVSKMQIEKLKSSYNLLLKKKHKENPINVHEELARNKIDEFNKRIKAYVDVCCHTPGLLDEAFTLLQKFKKSDMAEPTPNAANLDLLAPLNSESNIQVDKDAKPQLNRIKEHEVLNDVEIFNKVMFEYAKLGKTTKINLLFRAMYTNLNEQYCESLRPNLNSFAAAFQSLGCELGKLSETNMKKESSRIRLQVERILWDMKNEKISIDDLATSLHFSSQQQNQIKSAVNLLIPEFEFKDCVDFSSLNPLLRNLKTFNTGKNHASYVQTKQNKSYPEEMTNKELIMENFEKQVEIERSSLIAVPSILDDPVESKYKSKNKVLKEKILQDFAQSITRRFMKMLALLKQSSNSRDAFLYPFLSFMDKSIYVDIMLKEVIMLSQNSQFFTSNIQTLSSELGNAIETKYQEHCMKKNGDFEKIKTTYDKYTDYTISKLDPNAPESSIINNHREEWIKVMRELNSLRNLDDHTWPYSIKQTVGKFLFEKVLIKACKINRNLIKHTSTYKTNSLNNKSKYQYTKENAFNIIYRLVGFYKEPQIKIHPVLANLFGSDLIFESNRLPMITLPMPWFSPSQGGYFLSKSNLLRLKSNASEQINLVEKTHPSNMYSILDSLNALSSCPWRINTRILDLTIDIFKKNGNKELDIPENAEFKGPEIPKLDSNAKSDKKELKAFYKQKEASLKIKAEMHSQWCSELYRLSIANMFRDKVIWFPHSLDFRGRTYPIPPHFNHLGSDLARSLIVLAEGKKLGPSGLDTLKIHLINLTGTMKKSTIKERLDHANSIIEDIIDSAEKPFDGKCWWQKSEEKWQTLACCMEIADAIKSKNPAEFISHFPIHQDGSCNGLQHYAALGRDQEGALSVNLHPSERPKDVYSSVLELVEAEREKEEATNELAKLLKGHIKRKVIKQTVMTTVYNVTFYGAKLQILRQLEDLKEFPAGRAREASDYIAKKTFLSIRKLFYSAREIQDWFTECAYLITKIRDCALRWETPLGLPVSQPYYKRIYGTQSKMTQKPDSIKQRNAFPPNFIHSLDSSHMMLTSLFCEKAGVTFVSVHDCFWTHARDVDIMNKICREQFVALHSLPLLENLADYFSKNYKFTREEIESEEKEQLRELMIKFNDKLDSVPTKGDFDINKVLESRYFFS